MSEPVLAPEEIDALIREVAPDEETQAVFATLPPLNQPESVSDYQFGGANEESPERYPMFVNLQERLVETLDEQWDELFKRDVSIAVDTMTTTPYKELISTDTPQVYFVFEVEGNGRMLLTFDTALIVAFVDAMLGGNGEATDNPQSLSPVELRLSQRIADKLCTTMTRLWAPVEKLDFTFYKLDYDPQFLAVTGAMEKCFSTTFKARLSDDLEGSFGVHYPRPFLEPLLDTLRVTVSDEAVEVDQEWNDSLITRLSEMDADLHFELGRCTIDIGRFLNLKPGDHLPLKTRPNDPCTLWVEDIPLYKARPGEREGALAAEILEPIKPGGQK